MLYTSGKCGQGGWECCTKSAAAVVAGCRKVVVEKLTFVVKYIDDTLDQSPKKKIKHHIFGYTQSSDG